MDTSLHITPSTQFEVNNWLFGRGSVIKVKEDKNESRNGGKRWRKQLSERHSLHLEQPWSKEKQEQGAQQKPERAKLRKAQRTTNSENQERRHSWLSEVTLSEDNSHNKARHEKQKAAGENGLMLDKEWEGDGRLRGSSSQRSTLHLKPRPRLSSHLQAEVGGDRKRRGNSIGSDATLVGTASGSTWSEKRDSTPSFCQFDNTAGLRIFQSYPTCRLGSGPATSPPSSHKPALSPSFTDTSTTATAPTPATVFSESPPTTPSAELPPTTPTFDCFPSPIPTTSPSKHYHSLLSPPVKPNMGYQEEVGKALKSSKALKLTGKFQSLGSINTNSGIANQSKILGVLILPIS